TPHHIRVTQNFFLKLLEQDYIFIDTTRQYYSPAEKRFLPDRYIEGKCSFCGSVDTRSDYCETCNKILDQGDILEPKSKLTNFPVELKNTEHYFVDWGKIQKDLKLSDYVENHKNDWREWVYKESLGWLKEGLKPRAITRDLDWGVPLPVEKIPPDKRIENIENKRIYVWFDAVIGYYSASLLWAKMQRFGLNQEEAESKTDIDGGNSLPFGRQGRACPPTCRTGRPLAGLVSAKGTLETDLLENELADWWLNKSSKHYYFMGQDNLVFHTLFWPGKLKAYNSKLHLPDVVSINKFLNLEGRAFSKSRGISISISDIVKKYGHDPVRFYLTYIMPETRQSSFYLTDFQEKVNSVLIGSFGNFIHRTLSIARKVDIQRVSQVKLEGEVGDRIARSFIQSRDLLDRCEFRKYLDTIITLSNFANKLFDQKGVWRLKKEDIKAYAYSLKSLYALVMVLGYLALPLMPESAAKILNLLGLEAPACWPEFGDEVELVEKLIPQIDTGIEPEPLFRKIEEEGI
ncbi:class I tRNA ligase family protein, partial [Patescibacteria group bacterium]|nr:class I tRNA ligase family protein [Patescibacteria group bacterium]